MNIFLLCRCEIWLSLDCCPEFVSISVSSDFYVCKHNVASVQIQSLTYILEEKQTTSPFFQEVTSCDRCP